MTQINNHNVPKLRFSEFSTEWNYTPIASVFDFHPTNSLSRNDLEDHREGILNIHYGDIHTRLPSRLDTTCIYLPTVKEEKHSVAERQAPIEVGDIIFADASEDTSDIGKMIEIVAVGDRKVVSGLHTIHAKPKSDKRPAVGFCTDLFKSTRVRQAIIRESQGAKVLGLSSKKLGSISIHLPVQAEQQKISDFLGSIDNKITQLTKKRTLFEDYKKGCTKELLSQRIRFSDTQGGSFPDWEEHRLGDVVEIYDGTHQTPKYVSEGVPFYSVEHVTSNNFEKTKFIAEDVFEKENRRVKIETGDILLTRIGDIGTSRLIDWDVRASFYVSLALIKSSIPNIGAFLSHYMSHDDFQRELWHRTIHVAFPRKINLGEIGNCKIFLPHPDEQHKISEFLSSVDIKICQVDQELTQTQAFKKALLQQMFI